jgi:hypothetical protein
MKPSALQKLFPAVLLCTALFTGRAFAQVPHFHKLFTDTNAFFSRSHYQQSIVVTSTNIFTLLDHDGGALLVKTDLSGNMVWSHLYGATRTNAATLRLGVGDDLILAATSATWDDATISKIDSGTGNVLWSKRYPTLVEIATITRRGNRYVVMASSSYSGRSKPVAISINDADGSVAWAKQYLEVDATYTTDYNHVIHAATSNADAVVFAGLLYNDINISLARPRVTMLTIDAGNGNVSTGAMHSYDVNWLATGAPLETDSPFVWDISPVNTSNGAPAGFTLAGTYPLLAGSGQPAVVRLDQNGALLWAKLYRSSNSSSGFGRGIRQNDFFNAGRLDLYTSWTFYRNAIDGTGTASGLMRLNEVDGTVVGMTVYDAPGYYAGLRLHADGAGGYLLLGTKDLTPFTSFELIKVGQVGGGVSCTAEDTTLTTQLLSVTDLSIALVSPTITVTPVDETLTWVDRALTTTDCNCP